MNIANRGLSLNARRRLNFRVLLLEHKPQTHGAQLSPIGEVQGLRLNILLGSPYNKKIHVVKEKRSHLFPAGRVPRGSSVLEGRRLSGRRQGWALSRSHNFNTHFPQEWAHSCRSGSSTKSPNWGSAHRQWIEPTIAETGCVVGSEQVAISVGHWLTTNQQETQEKRAAVSLQHQESGNATCFRD